MKYYFGPGHPFQPIRVKLTLGLLKELKIFDSKAKIFEARKARESELLLIHSKEYVNFVKERSERGEGFLDYGDTPATKEIFEGACWAVGGTLTGIDLIMEGKVIHAFNPSGGLHHAKRNSAAGFCVFNDLAIGVEYLREKYGVRKVAIIDIDGHHGDGTQEIFYDKPILKISFHRYDGFFYPRTGNWNEIGIGKGKGYSVNIPLPINTSDETYLYAFKEIVPPLIKAYEPEIIIHQFGVDGHFGDPLVGLKLTTRAYEEIANITHELSHKICKGKYLIVGGGGYNIQNVKRCWGIMFLTVAGVKNEINKLHDKKTFEKDERTFRKVKETVEKIKEIIFPLHGIKV